MIQEIKIMPTEAQDRKERPVWSGVVEYFPNAIIAVSKCSFDGNQQHHPDKPLHWDMSKSQDEMDALMRHAMEGEWDKVAWRALAKLEREIQDGYLQNVGQSEKEPTISFEDWYEIDAKPNELDRFHELYKQPMAVVLDEAATWRQVYDEEILGHEKI